MALFLLGRSGVGPCVRPALEPASSSSTLAPRHAKRQRCRGATGRAATVDVQAAQRQGAGAGPGPGSSNSSSSTALLGGSLALTRCSVRGVQTRVVVAEAAPAAAPPGADITIHLNTLKQCCGVVDDECEVKGTAAIKAAAAVRDIVAYAVNTKSPGTKNLQSTVVSSGALTSLTTLARRGYPVAFEALQICCYRNPVACQQLLERGAVDIIATALSDAPIEQQCSMCFLLTALAAFADSTHAPIMNAGLVPKLVLLCQAQTAGHTAEMADRIRMVRTRAAAVIRNLAHNQKNHAVLIQAGAVDPLVDIMRTAKDPASRINAAVAVACLVGHEEGNPRLALDEELVGEMLDVLEAACQGSMQHGVFWTVWKLCQGLASLSVNDKNKELITARGGVSILAEVVMGKHHNEETAHRFALSALWNLAFSEASKQVVVGTPGLVDAMRRILQTSESPKTREVAKGALWTLGLEQDVKNLQEGAGRLVAQELAIEPGVQPTQHVMLSYEWGCQSSVMLIKNELQKAGYQTWMDIDKMSGSTLEAMAKAVEDSAAVLICVSKRYKESQACRTEAEYAFQQRKKIIPVLLEADYRPTGWLGALMGTRLYFNMSDGRKINGKMGSLMKELGEAGRLNSQRKEATARSSGGYVTQVGERADGWTVAEVEEWLKRIRCGEYVGTFRQHSMDGMALAGLFRLSCDMSLMHATLRDEFGMSVIGQRMRLVEELYRLFGV